MMHLILLYPLYPHGGAAGSDRTSVWRSQSTRPGGGVRVPAVAPGKPAGGGQHPGSGGSLPEG